ncbi:MAG: STAS domain-containing protein [Sideroxydans sp.]|nr:STAS domain-containing protein [Sideroxydans sp.]
MITREGGQLKVSGPLTLETVKALYDQGLQAAGANSLAIDMSGVGAVDSSAVSLMLNWLREAQRNNVSVSFSHVPDNLLSLARLYDVAELLPLSIDASMQS